MYKDKFTLLFEEIMKTTISVDSFDFDFTQLENDDIECKFNTLNDEGKLISVVGLLKADGTMEFTVADGKVAKTLDEKTFMLKFYKDYEKLKTAFNNYKDEVEKEKNKNKSEKINQNDIESDGKLIPGVKSFDSKLNAITTKNKGEVIKAGPITFTVKFIEDQVKNLIQINFDLINNNPNEDELQKYNAVVLVKLINKNSVISKIILHDPENYEDKIEKSKSEFKERWPEIFKYLSEVINKIEKTV